MSLHKPKSVRFLNLNHEKYFEEYSGRKLEEEEEEEKKEQASNNFPAFLYTEWLTVISESIIPLLGLYYITEIFKYSKTESSKNSF